MFSLSADDVKKVVINAIGSTYAVTNYSLEPFFENKFGAFGSHSLLKISVKNLHSSVEDCEAKSLSFFVKTLPESQVIRDLSDDTAFEELNFYRNIKPLMHLDHESERWSPECYLAENNVLVFEDLRAQGFSMNHEPVMDERFLKSALAALARFHASTLVAELRLGKPLNEAFPKFLSEKIFDASKKFGQYTILGFQTMVLMAEKLDLDADFVLPHMYDYVHEAVRPREGELNVLCHSDLWNNNLLFNKNVVPECVIVDYQVLRYATPVLDLSMLVYSNTTPEYRGKFENKLVDYYYAIFQESVEKSNVKRKIPTLESMINTYKKYRIFGMTMSSLSAPLRYVEFEDTQKLINDPKALERYMLYDRMEVFGPYLETSPTYVKKVKDVLCEVLNEGKRVLNL